MHVKNYVRQESKIPLVIITGFLGAGKTTMLNNLLDQLKDKKTGVIVNEFGDINVDAQLIDLEEKNGISEINNGSIFCSCLSGSFVKTIAEYKDLDLDYLFVESSGMSRPKSIDSIIDSVNDITDYAFDYRGMICIVDASNFSKIIQSLASAREQVAYSDLVIINKTDLVDKAEADEIESKINLLNPGVEIIKTNYSNFDISNLDNIFSSYKANIEFVDNINSEDFSRPEAISFEFDNGLGKDKLDKLLEELFDHSYRVKGFVRLKNEQTFLINVTQNEIKVNEHKRNIFDNSKLVIFAKDKEKVNEIIKSY